MARKTRAGKQQPEQEREQHNEGEEAEGGSEGEDSEEGEEGEESEEGEEGEESEEGEKGEESEESEEGESEEESEEGEELSIDQDTGRIIAGGTVNYATRVFDNAVRVSDALLADCKTVFTARETGEEGEYSAGSTFFVRADAAPKTALELLALQIFRFHTRDAVFDPARSGAEWWTQVIETEADIAWHWDRDYDLQDAQGIQIHPHLATVTYVNAGGAPTVVLARASPLLASASLEGEVGACTACSPRVGRHLSFDGRMLHGAPSSVLEPPATAKLATAKPATAEPAVPLRVTFLVNLWLNHAPGGAAPLPAAVRAKLRPAAPATSNGEVAFSQREITEVEIAQLDLPARAAAKGGKAAAKPLKPLRWSFGDPARGATTARALHLAYAHMHQRMSMHVHAVRARGTHGRRRGGCGSSCLGRRRCASHRAR